MTAGNSCLIVEDETHFTIWHQEPVLEPTQATQAAVAPTPNKIQHFAQQFAATKQVRSVVHANEPAMSCRLRHAKFAQICKFCMALMVPAYALEYAYAI